MPKDLLPQGLDIHITGKDLPSSTFGGPVSSFAVLSKLDINTNLFEEVGRTVSQSLILFFSLSD